METNLIEVIVFFKNGEVKPHFFKSYVERETYYDFFGLDGNDSINMTIPFENCLILKGNDKENVKVAVSEMSRFVNNYGVDLNAFCEVMSREHRTLQNTFTKLCLTWLEYTSKEEYRTDPRNQTTKDISRKLMELWRNKMISDGWTKETLELMSKPSQHISFI